MAKASRLIAAGVALARRHGLDALFVLRDGMGFAEISVVDGQVCGDKRVSAL